MRNLNKSMGKKNDERNTPPILVKPILDFIPTDKIVWCPFDKKNSEFVKAFRKRGNKVIYGHIDEGKDFFEYKPNEYDIVVSNPPFSLPARGVLFIDRITEKVYNRTNERIL